MNNELDNEFVFTKKELGILITESKRNRTKWGFKNEEIGRKVAGGETEVKRKRENVYRDRARESVRKAVKSITMYADTQDSNQLEQVFESGDIYEMVKVLCDNIPDSKIKLRIAANLVSLGLDVCLQNVPAPFYGLIDKTVFTVKDWASKLAATQITTKPTMAGV